MAKIKRVHFNLLKRAPESFKQQLKIHTTRPDVVELSFGSDDETVLLQPFSGDFDVEDNVRNIPDNQVSVGPNNAPLAPNNIGHQARNVGRAE